MQSFISASENPKNDSNIKKTEKKINRQKGYNNFKKKCKPLKKHEMQLEKP